MTEEIRTGLAPTRRGRRDPEIAAQLALNGDDQEAGITDDDEMEMPLLFEGDVVGRKVTVDVIVDGRSQWVTSEVRTRVYPGEPADSASERVRIAVNADLLEQIEDAEQLLLERARNKRQARISPR